jgi:hypothetical protein
LLLIIIKKGYIIKSRKNLQNYDIVIFSNGNGLISEKYSIYPKENISNGVSFSIYSILEKYLGFAFFQPFEPLFPNQEIIEERISDLLIDNDINYKTKPDFSHRGIHLHTQHSMELVDLLNGFGFGLNESFISWRNHIDKYELLMEWLVASHQNRLEWFGK